MLADLGGGRFDQIANLGVDHSPYRLVNQTAPANGGMEPPDVGDVARKKAQLFELLDPYQPRTQAVVDIVVVIGDFIGKVADLRFQRRLPAHQEAFTDLTQLAGVFQGTMLDDSFARLEAEVESVKCSIALLERINDALHDWSFAPRGPICQRVSTGGADDRLV